METSAEAWLLVPPTRRLKADSETRQVRVAAIRICAAARAVVSMLVAMARSPGSARQGRGRLCGAYQGWVVSSWLVQAKVSRSVAAVREAWLRVSAWQRRKASTP